MKIFSYILEEITERSNTTQITREISIDSQNSQNGYFIWFIFKKMVMRTPDLYWSSNVISTNREAKHATFLRRERQPEVSGFSFLTCLHTTKFIFSLYSVPFLHSRWLVWKREGRHYCPGIQSVCGCRPRLIIGSLSMHVFETRTATEENISRARAVVSHRFLY